MSKQAINKDSDKKHDGLLRKWKFLEQIMEDQVLTSSTKVVAARLLMHHNSKEDRCDFTSERTLAKRLGLVQSTVYLAIKQLKQEGWLNANQPARHQVNEYSFNWDKRSENQVTLEVPRKSSQGDLKIKSGCIENQVTDDLKNHEPIDERINEKINENTHGAGAQTTTDGSHTTTRIYSHTNKGVSSHAIDGSQPSNGRSSSQSLAASGGGNVAHDSQPQAANTPLKIPFGKNADNREVAKSLGAIYDRDSGVRFAPPGVDLAAFKTRGWLPTIPPNSSLAIQEEMRQSQHKRELEKADLQERICQARLEAGLPEPQQVGMMG